MTPLELSAGVLFAAAFLLTAGGAAALMNTAFGTGGKWGWTAAKKPFYVFLTGCVLLAAAAVFLFSLSAGFYTDVKTWAWITGAAGGVLFATGCCLLILDAARAGAAWGFINSAGIAGAAGGVLFLMDVCPPAGVALGILAGFFILLAAIFFVIHAKREDLGWNVMFLRGLFCFFPAALFIAAAVLYKIEIIPFPRVWGWVCLVAGLAGPVIFMHLYWKESRLPLFVMAGGLALAPLALALNAYFPQTSPLYREAAGYLREQMPGILGKWNARQLIGQCTPPFRGSFTEQEMLSLFGYWSQLGALESMSVRGNNPNTIEGATHAYFVISGRFARGAADAVVHLVKKEGVWAIDEFILQTGDLPSYETYLSSRQAARELLDERPGPGETRPETAAPDPSVGKKPALPETAGKKEPPGQPPPPEPEPAIEETDKLLATPEGIQTFMDRMKITGASAQGAVINGKYHETGAYLGPENSARLVRSGKKLLVFKDKYGKTHKVIPFQKGAYDY